jgi:hypothetical protein
MILVLAAGHGLSACLVVTGGDHAAHPQRPTYSSDTNTTDMGTLEVELGLALDPSDSFDTPATVKFGATPFTEVFVGFSPYQWVERPGDNGHGIGDHVLGARHRFWEDDRGHSAAAQTSIKIPTADEDEGLGTGEFDFVGAGIFTAQIDSRFSSTLFGELALVGDPGGGNDLRHALASAASYALTEDTAAFAEIAKIFHSDGADPLFTTLGIARTLFPGTILDVGVAIGLNDDAPDAILLVGVTTNLGKLFPYSPDGTAGIR